MSAEQIDATAQIIMAPDRQSILHQAVFLAGSTKGTWRQDIKAALSRYAVTILDPYREDWEVVFKHEERRYPPFRHQVDWELDMQERASVVVVYFHPDTQAPVSLLELGLSVGRRKTVVVCPAGYWKRGNVQVVCDRYGVEIIESDSQAWEDEVMETLLTKLKETLGLGQA
jgi:hypothetical protein